MAKTIDELYEMYQEDPKSLRKKDLIRMVDELRGVNSIQLFGASETVVISNELTEEIAVEFLFDNQIPDWMSQERFDAFIEKLAANTGIVMADRKHDPELKRLAQDAIAEGAFEATIQQIKTYDVKMGQRLEEYVEKRQQAAL